MFDEEREGRIWDKALTVAIETDGMEAFKAAEHIAQAIKEEVSNALMELALLNTPVQEILPYLDEDLEAVTKQMHEEARAILEAKPKRHGEGENP